MKVIKLVAENIKKLTAVEISPDGNMVQITGKNGQGKTSVLDCLWWAFTGADNIQAQPIRSGEEKARIELQLGTGDAVELVVKRTFTETKSYLSVETADGAKYPKPQDFLNDVIGALSLDPLAFMRAKGKEQFDILRALVTLDIDPEELDRLNKEDFEARALLNRDAKAKRAQASTIIVPDGEVEAVDEADLLDQLAAAASTNADIERRKANRVNAEKQIAAQRESIVKWRADAERIEAEAEALAVSTDKLEKSLKEAGELPALVDVSDLRHQLDNAKAINAGALARSQWEFAKNEAVALEERADALTGAMEGRTAIKQAAIAAAAMPVKGLSFGDGVVTFNGLPLNQASDAEQLTVSMSIAAAMNPKLRVLRIRDGSLLDDDAMNRLAAFADERDMQVWIERVDGSGTVGFVMEDGHVRGQMIEPAPEKASSKKKVAA